MRRRAPFSLMRPPQRTASRASRCEWKPPARHPARPLHRVSGGATEDAAPELEWRRPGRRPSRSLRRRPLQVEREEIIVGQVGRPPIRGEHGFNVTLVASHYSTRFGCGFTGRLVVDDNCIGRAVVALTRAAACLAEVGELRAAQPLLANRQGFDAAKVQRE